MNKISIIIPVFNEAKILPQTLLNFANYCEEEIIVVDGGSQDETIELCQTLGVKVICSPLAGRAYQMNVGAAEATGDILLFLHADTQLPQGYPEMLRETLAQPQTIAGAFELKIDSQQQGLRLVEKMVNWRSRFCSLPYGDQAFFLKASTFQEMNGFANLPIMEDFDLIQRLKKRGKIAIVPAAVLTSDRRWQKLGIGQTTLVNQLIILGYYLGVSPSKLARWYRRKLIKN